MKKATWDNPNKMHFESDFKLFNKQTNLITTGNAWCNTQYSSFVRPWNEVKNGGYTGKPGDFLKYDMQGFCNVPEHIRKNLFDKERKESYILYEFFVYQNGRREIIGHVLTDYNDRFIADNVNCNYGQSYFKRESAINECKKYICA